MAEEEKFFDIYLWVFPKNDELIKIEHLTSEEAHALTDKWFELNELHDYMLVTEKSTPFIDEPSIKIKPKEWFMNVKSIEDL